MFNYEISLSLLTYIHTYIHTLVLYIVKRELAPFKPVPIVRDTKVTMMSDTSDKISVSEDDPNLEENCASKVATCDK